MKKLPILLSIPHGGATKPKEIINNLCITDKDLFNDSDPFVIEIYDLKDKVKKVIKTDIARAFVDLNRAPEDLPPNNPDGVIKSSTCYQKPIYSKRKEPDEELRRVLIETYYKPYHKLILKSIKDKDLKLCLDCHSMAAVAPDISPDGDKKERPLFCISNQDGKTASNEMINFLADCISKSFSIERKEIFLNDPFQGGYITRTYGNNPIPWIQIEMNRSLYLNKPWFNETKRIIDPSHLKKLNKNFEKSLELFCSQYFQQ
ncbi:N-formylglutamate amidohydrolase [Nitrosopumilus sp. K4]|uniref:N-formylglutamate amidohydrolase n=1 Tax=Nitrosopumilus sp. K4 TaxID=2795383 RepID=UPI001BAD7DC5|nr:N-formylglutamate amidohydrolase [Nitrosopumilus sp. K4]QUC65272.1 N-formylglutamate amidohydrolase [Nitrosopumilus sp. K4]